MGEPVEDPFAAATGLEGVPSALAAALDAVDTRLRDRGMRRTTPELTAEALLRGAVASAQLAGSASTIDEVRRVEGDEVATAALRVNSDLLALVPVVARSPLQALARLHALASAGLAPADQVGRPRPEPEAAAALVALAARLLAPTRAPAIAVAAIAHADLMIHAPFAVGNTLVARALERLVLVSRGVDPASVLVPEAGHLALRERYDDALAAYADGGAAGQRIWLTYAGSALAASLAACPLPT